MLNSVDYPFALILRPQNDALEFWSEMGVVQMPCPVYTWSAELCYTAIADFLSCKEFGGHGHYIHFCDHTNLIGNGKDAFVSICQNHQKLSKVLTVKVLRTCCAGTGFIRDFTSGVAMWSMSQSLGFSWLTLSSFIGRLSQRMRATWCFLTKASIMQDSNWGSSNRLYGCSVRSESDSGKTCFLCYDSKFDANSGLCVIQWYDNHDSRSQQITLAAFGIHPIRIVKGWDKKVKKYVEVQFPTDVTECNACEMCWPFWCALCEVPYR